MKLSVIITSYDQHDLTALHVRECMDVSLLPDEIVVINDGGSPDLKEKLLALDRKVPIVYARINEDIPWNYNGACNLAVWLSRGELLAFEDNDNIPTLNFYKDAVNIFETRPEVGRVIARKRVVIEDIFKPKNEWVVRNKIGPNQGTSMIRRSVFLDLKGMDERFCGRYGWMYYDFKHRLLDGAKTTFASHGEYYYTDKGQSGLSRRMSGENFKIFRQNAQNHWKQSRIGILNFTYEYEIL